MTTLDVLHRAEAAAREVLRKSFTRRAQVEDALHDLLAALDAARGQAVRSELRFYQSSLTPPRWSPWMEDSDAEAWAEEMRAKGRRVEVRHLFAAPPAAAVPDWRALYRFQTAMRYMDADAKLTRDKAYAMADHDVAAMLAAAQAERAKGVE